LTKYTYGQSSLEHHHKFETRGVALPPFTLKKHLKAKKKKNYGYSNISQCKKYNLQKNPLKKRNQNPSRYYYNSRTNLKFEHKPKYHLSKILI
jgi:hypothetical protein